MNPGRMGLIGAPTFPMLRDVTQRTFFEVLELEEIDYTFRSTDRILTLHHNASQVIFRSLEDYERLRGTNLAWFGIDELTYCKAEAWSRLEARLRDPKALRLCGFGVWTPKGFDWVYERFIANPKPGNTAYLGSPRENYHLRGDFYDSLAQSYDEKFYAQEVLGEYLNVFSGQCYGSFSRQHNIRPGIYTGSGDIWLCCDFNVNPMCWAIVHVQETTDRMMAMAGRRSHEVQVLDEICLPNSDISQAARVAREKLARLSRGQQLTVYVSGDAAGNSRTHAGATDWQLVFREFANDHAFKLVNRVPSVDPLVKDRVNSVNAMLGNSIGSRRLFVDPGCLELIKDFEQVSWKTDMSGGVTREIDKSKDPKRTHVSDAVGYLIHDQFGIKSTAGWRQDRLI